jgi:hypothetical protein
MSNKYYVYEYVRLDTNEPFYIGKGTTWRWRDLKRSRSKYFKNIVNNIPVAVTILEDNLDEKTAFEYEAWYIWQLRDIQGYSLINISDGGDGGDVWVNKPEQEKEEFINNLKQIFGDGRMAGGNNPTAKPVAMLDLNNNILETFSCIKEVNDKYGFHRERISNACKNAKIYKGFKWKYL